VLYVVWTQAELGGATVTLAFSDIIIGLAAAAAGVACVGASRRQTGWPGRGWLLIGVGMLCWALGEGIWTWYEVVLGQEVPFPSYADAGFLLMVPLTLVGMAAMLNFERGALRTLLDAFMVAGSLLFISWPFVLEPTYRAGGQGLFDRSIALAYPIGDIVVAAMAFVLLSQTARQARGSIALAGTGMLALAVADSGFAYLTVNEAYSSASIIDPGWFVGFLLIALAGLRMRRTVTGSRRRQAAPLLVALPYVPLGAAMVTSIVVKFSRGSVGTFLYLTLMLLVVLVVLRQVVTLRENLTLTRQLHATVTELGHREAEMRHLAFHDPLTGLANRALLQQRTEGAVERLARERISLAVLYIDLDNFKPVNDEFGHPAGDALLVMVAERLRGCTRPSDTVARIGGDEFAILLDGLLDERDAESLARRIVTELATPFVIDDRPVQISASVGVAVERSARGRAGDLLRDADMAMYNAKFNGKNNLVCFDATLRNRIATS
jgi:diguanylate cyclase (GGDEF)-like protein